MFLLRVDFRARLYLARSAIPGKTRNRASILTTDLELLLRECLGRYFVVSCFEAFSTAKWTIVSGRATSLKKNSHCVRKTSTVPNRASDFKIPKSLTKGGMLPIFSTNQR